MKALFVAALLASSALVVAPTASQAFSLRSAFGFHTNANAPDQGDVPPADVGSGESSVGSGRSSIDSGRSSVMLAQAPGDDTVRVQQLEDSVRQLTGKVEDLNYQLLQMQEQMRQMQKDNEFRFQQLEGGHGGGGSASQAPSRDRSDNSAPTPDSSRELARRAAPSDEPRAAEAQRDSGLGAPPRSLGTTFLDSHQKYPKAEKAPETLLKLGMSLAALDNRDTACATYQEVLKRYPKASSSVRQKVAAEEKRTGC
jgi:TolA-binding protein